ncbi:MAG: enoyl-CoA hydratase/isomerase family protein [Gammaproteobacteria bacterium]
MHDKLVSLEVSGPRADITISREAKLNALSRATLDALGKAFDSITDREELRCVTLTGAGDRFFAAGGDVVELSAVRTESEINAMADHACAVLDKIRNCHVPVVAVINGDALGGGAELATSCDFRIMSIGARIGFIQGRLAINSAWGGGADLGALVGPARCLRMMSRCEMIDAATALSWGLADEITERDEAHNCVAEFVRPITHLSAISLEAFIEQSRAHRLGAVYQQRRTLEREALLRSWPQEAHWSAVEKFLARK